MGEARCCNQCPCECNRRTQGNWPNQTFIPEQTSTPIHQATNQRAEQTNAFQTRSNHEPPSSPLNITWTELTLLRERLTTLETRVKSIERKITGRMAQSRASSTSPLVTAGHHFHQPSRGVILSGLKNRVIKAVEREFDATSTLLAQ